MHKKTFIPAVTHDDRWFVVDATDQVLGRLATQIADKLRGRDLATWTPHQDPRTHVVVVNAASFAVSGRKETDKIYRDHSGFKGGLKEETLESIRETDPERPIRDAVKRMLPKSKLASQIIKRLHLFPGAEHSYAAQKPAEMAV